MYTGERIVSPPNLTSFADPFEVRFRLSVDNLLLANFEEISPIFYPFAFFGKFSETISLPVTGRVQIISSSSILN